MCSAPINGRTLTHTLPAPADTPCQKVIGTKDLQQSIFSYLSVRDMHAVQNVSKALSAPILLKTSPLDLREKVLDFQTLERIHKVHSPRALRVKLSENWQCEDLIERCKQLPSILSLDLTECPDISIEDLIRASKELAQLEEIHLKDDEKHPLDLESLIAFGKSFNLSAIHIKSEKGGLLYSVIQNSAEEEFIGLQALPITSIDMSRVHLPMSLADPFLKQRLSSLPSLETLSLPAIYEDEPAKTCLISDEHIAPFKKAPVKHLFFSSALKDTAFAALADFPHLESLSFSDDTIVDDARLGTLQGLHLKKLRIDNAKGLTEKGLAFVRHFPLVQLSLDQARIAPEMLQIIAGFEHLGTLRLQHCTLISSATPYLGSLRRLKVLDLTGTYVYSKIRLNHPLEKLIMKDTRLFFSFSTIEQVESTEIDISSSTDGAVIQNLSALRNSRLRKLTANNVVFNDYALLTLSELSDLTEATFSIADGLSEKAHISLRRLKLQHLTLVDSRIDDLLLNSIARISTLRTLNFKDITHSNITENGFLQLKQLHNLTSISSRQILDDFATKKQSVKSLFSDPWLYKVFRNIACLRIKYPATVWVSSKDMDIHTTVTALGDLPNSIERTQAFFVQNIRQQFRFKTQYINAIESGRLRILHPGTMHAFVPRFEPTIIQAWCRASRFQPLYIQIPKPEHSKLPAVPMTLVDDDKWNAVFNIPIQSYRLFKKGQVDIHGSQEVSDWGFGCTHNTYPVFPATKQPPPFIVVRAHSMIPKGHTLYLQSHRTLPKVPMVQIAPDLWEARVGKCTQYKLFLDNIHEEIGDGHLVVSDTNICTPRFKDNLKHAPTPPLTTVFVQYSAPAGHSVFLRNKKESFPMVPIRDSLWEARFVRSPGSVLVTLDDIVVAEGRPFVPQAGKRTRVNPTFAFDKVLQHPLRG